ncbi:Atherin [Nibea albiflora]|uniref:Atherin n=1 Tax=Nibea albiflora TaxID=240163 RepID=A0ACB7EXV7_NIBAL|nr:Atherin [Nibea albiflora]
MSESKYREWILDTIDSLRSRKARPDLERICRMVRRRHGSEPDRTCAELEKLIQEQTVLKVNYKGSISYRNAAKADTSMAMDTDSNADEEGADESRDGQDRPSPARTYDDAAVHCASARAVSAPCSPSGNRPGPGPGCSPGSGLDCVSFQKAAERPSSLPPSSPRALAHNDWAYHSAVCPTERQHPGMQRDKAATKPANQPVTTSPGTLKNNVKKEDGGKAEDSGLSSDQLVPDYAAGLDETKNVSEGRPQTLSLPSDNCTFKNKIDISPFTAAEDSLLNGGKDDEVSVKKEKMSQNLLQWTVADVASYFSAAGFPEQAVAFRTQEIDGKSLLLMQRSDVLTGLSIRLGPALKIYERHVKVLQRTHFLEYEDI